MEKPRTINEQVRFNLNQKIERGISSCKTLDIIIESIIDNFSKDMLTNNNEYLWEYIMGLSFVDTFRIYSFKNKKGLLNTDEKEVFYYIYNIKDNVDLYSELSSSIDFFKKLLEGLYDFYNFTPLSKWELTKSLTKEEISKILSIFPNSQIDLERDCQWVTLNTIIETIKLEINNYENNLGYYFEEGIISNIVSFIKSMFYLDKDNAIALYMELAKLDYLASLYVKDKSLNDFVVTNHIKVYQNSSLEEIISMFYQNQKFVAEVVKMLFDIYISKNHNMIKIDANIINRTNGDETLHKLELKKVTLNKAT